MSPLTRRDALHGAVALLAGLAGCGEADRSRNSPTELSRPENVEIDPPVAFVRGQADEPVVWFEQPDRTDTETDSHQRDTTPRGADHEFIMIPERAESLVFAEDADGVEDARAFLDETDFDRETVYLLEQRVGECYRLDLCYVTWEDDDFDIQFASEYRDADVACDADSQDRLAVFARLPAVLDPDDFRGYGRGSSSSGCRTPRGWETESSETESSYEGGGP